MYNSANLIRAPTHKAGNYINPLTARKQSAGRGMGDGLWSAGRCPDVKSGQMGVWVETINNYFNSGSTPGGRLSPTSIKKRFYARADKNCRINE